MFNDNKLGYRMRLKGSNVFITGGSSGIGFALVKGFLEEGANVAFTYRKEDSLKRSHVQELLNQYPEVYPIPSDFSNSIDAENLLNNMAEKFGTPINVLINNAAAFSRATFLETTRNSLTEILNVNLVTPFVLISAFAKMLIASNQPGSIINISSLSATMARSKMAAYQASKAGLEMLSTSAAYELAPYNIRSNIIAPGLTETPANEEQRKTKAEIWAERSALIPLGRAGVPQDFIGAAVYLASLEARWVTGAKIIIDGGMSSF